MVCIAIFAATCLAASIDDQQFNGRWDISVNGGSTPPRGWWLEVSGAGSSNLKGRFVGAPVGMMEEIPKLSIADAELRFALDGKYRREKPAEKGLYWARLEGGKLKGTFEIEGDPSSYLEWTGVRAPALPDKDDGSWRRGEPVVLFDGRELNGWQVIPPVPLGRPPGWTVKEGVLSNVTGGDLVSEKKFFNFGLEVEYRLGPRANSGIGLRGRYEVQIIDDFDRPPSNRCSGAIVSRIPPIFNASRMAGEWQALAVRLVGRQVSVWLNGFKVIDRQSIDGPTSIALDSNEADPGPILLQGDRGPIEFRRIVVYPLIKRP